MIPKPLMKTIAIEIRSALHKSNKPSTHTKKEQISKEIKSEKTKTAEKKRNLLHNILVDRGRHAIWVRAPTPAVFIPRKKWKPNVNSAFTSKKKIY